MNNSDKQLTILHVLLDLRETGMDYNEFVLTTSDIYDVSVCSYFTPKITPPSNIRAYIGNNTVNGFIKNLSNALSNKPYDIIHLHSPHVGVMYLLATGYQKKYRRSTVYTVHNSYGSYKIRNKLFLLPVFASFQRIISCSRSSYESFPLIYKKLSKHRFDYIPNGVNIDRIDNVINNLENDTLNDNNFTIVCVGRMEKIKNQATLINAFHSINIPNSRLILIGDGSQKDNLVSLSDRLGRRERIGFTGLIPRESVYKYMYTADLFVSPSKGEGLPIAVMESMACYCPVILSTIPPHKEIIDGLPCPSSVQPDDTHGFAYEIRKFYNYSKSERSKIGEKHRKHIENKFSLRNMLKEYDLLYKQLL